MPIPVVDVRDGGPLRHAREGEARARALRDDCVAWFPGVARPFVPLLDRLARRWLSRSQSPYLDEIRAIAGVLGFPGIWFLNGSYQWSCTSLAREEDAVPWLVAHAGLAISRASAAMSRSRGCAARPASSST